MMQLIAARGTTKRVPCLLVLNHCVLPCKKNLSSCRITLNYLQQVYPGALYSLNTFARSLTVSVLPVPAGPDGAPFR